MAKNKQQYEDELPVEEDSFDEKNCEKTPRKYQIIGVAIIVAAIIIVISGIIKSGDGSNSSGANIATFIPIWVAVFIPLMNKNKKGKKCVSVKEKRILLIGILIAMVITGIIGYVIMNR